MENCENYKKFVKENPMTEKCPCVIEECKENKNMCANISSVNFGKTCVNK